MSHRASRHCAGPTAVPTDVAPHDDAPRPRADDRGFTLIEIVITITLMAIVVVAVLTAVSTSISASATGRSAAQVETAIVNAADRVNRAPKRCDYTIYVQAAVQTQGWPASTAWVTQEYYTPGVNAKTAGTWQAGPLGSACPGPAPADLLVQRVTIHLTSPDGAVRRTIQVVKSDV
jgi:prepilin-type N-terminal cleavage/methylation domain-containing protein